MSESVHRGEMRRPPSTPLRRRGGEQPPAAADAEEEGRPRPVSVPLSRQLGRRLRQLWRACGRRRPPLLAAAAPSQQIPPRPPRIRRRRLTEGEAAAALLTAVLAALALAVLLAVWRWPVTGSVLAGCAAATGVFVATEGEFFLHDALESEDRFWSLLALLASTALLFADDSPAALGRAHPALGAAAVAALVAWANYTSRRAVSDSLRRPPSLRRSRSAHLMDRESAHDKASRLDEALRSLDFAHVGMKVLRGRLIASSTATILELLSEATAEELNYCIGTVDLALALYKVKDRDLMAPGAPRNRRSELLELLAVRRLDELHVQSRAALLDALQRLRLTAHPRAEEFVRRVFLRTFGKQLAMLKCALDAKGSAQSLHKLVFTDVRSPAVRNDILRHFAEQAGVVREANRRYAAVYGHPPRGHVKIVSDVDDTLCSSGGRFPAGCDRRFARHVIYPGVLAFYRELDLGVSENGRWPGAALGNLVFLSARPHIYADVSERVSHRRFERMRIESGMHCVPGLLSGTLSSGRAVFWNNYEPIARTKIKNWDEFSLLYPEFSHVFVGDDGQGDVRAGLHMLASRPARSVLAVYIHRVSGKSEPPPHRAAGVVYFDTYPGAATDAARRGLIHPAGLRRVCASAVRGWNAMGAGQVLQTERARRQLNNDLEAANALLRDAQLREVPLLAAEQAFPTGAAVTTPYGRARVAGFRPLDGLYELELEWGGRAGRPPARAFMPAARMRTRLPAEQGEAVQTPYGCGVLVRARPDGFCEVAVVTCSARQRRLEGESKLGGGSGTCGVAAGFECPDEAVWAEWAVRRVFVRAHSVSRRLRAAPGALVATPYGAGRVERVRFSRAGRESGYVVVLGWSGRTPARAYLPPSSVQMVAPGGAEEDGRAGCALM